MQRVVQLAAEHIGGELRTPRGEEVGPPDVAHEERVAREHCVRDCVVGALVDDHADRLGSVPGRRDDLERHVAEREPFTVAQLIDGKVNVRTFPVGDDGTGASGELEMAAEEVGVDVRLDDPFDGEPELGSLREIVADVATGIDDHRPTRGLVTDEVGGVGQTPEVVLGEDHHRQASRHLVPRWWETGRSV